VIDSTGELTPRMLEQFGTPARIVDCGTYQIYDYRGTRGAAILSQQIASSVRGILP
jgi:hypothetical protein